MSTRDAWKAALWTALFAFVTLFGLALVGWLQDVWQWASDDSGAVLFPDPAVLLKALVAAVVSALIGLVNFVVRFAQAHGVVKGEGPTYVRRG